MMENIPSNTGDTGELSSILASGRSPGGGHDNPLQYSCLEKKKSMNRGAWWAIIYVVAKSQTWLSKRLSTHTVETNTTLQSKWTSTNVFKKHIHTTMYKINNKVLLWSTGNYTQYLITPMIEKNLKNNIYMCVCACVCINIHTVEASLGEFWALLC